MRLCIFNKIFVAWASCKSCICMAALNKDSYKSTTLWTEAIVLGCVLCMPRVRKCICLKKLKAYTAQMPSCLAYMLLTNHLEQCSHLDTSQIKISTSTRLSSWWSCWEPVSLKKSFRRPYLPSGS